MSGQLLAELTIRAYLRTDGRSDQEIDRLLNQYGSEIEAALEHALDAAAVDLGRHFPKDLLTFKVEEE